MRALVLTKRHTSGKDLLTDRYGRAYELARGLAYAGHDVAGIAIGYRGEPAEPPLQFTDGNVCVQWRGLTVDWHSPWQAFSTVDRVISDLRPDVLWCSGDALQVIAGVRLAHRYRIPVVADLYDNYEAFWITSLPGILQAFRRAVRSADGVTCVSNLLAHYIKGTYQPLAPISVVENGVCPHLYRGLSRNNARSELGYTDDQVLVGTAGSLRKRRGLETLLEAFELVRKAQPTSRLVLAGPLDRRVQLASAPAVDYLGELPPNRIPRLLTALDVGVICNQNNRFGRYCYPLKFAEMLQAGIPIVAANVGVMQQLLQNDFPLLYQPGDPNNLADVILQQIDRPIYPRTPPNTWDSLASDLEEFLLLVIKRFNDLEQSQ